MYALYFVKETCVNGNVCDARFPGYPLPGEPAKILICRVYSRYTLTIGLDLKSLGNIWWAGNLVICLEDGERMPPLHCFNCIGYWVTIPVYVELTCLLGTH